MSLAQARPSASAARSDLHERLRRETAEDHQRLEDGLDLLAEPLSRDRFGHVLSRFHGFHRSWEPAVEAALGEPLGARGRLACLELDLKALGMSLADIDGLPAWPEAGAMIDGCPDRALGSLYVLEGSTLGGQVISRALKGAAWAPEVGLAYFNPYGPSCGFMWAGMKRRLADRSSATADGRIVAGARATFAALGRWLCA